MSKHENFFQNAIYWRHDDAYQKVICSSSLVIIQIKKKGFTIDAITMETKASQIYIMSFTRLGSPKYMVT
jgi:hypothetical protein